MLQLTAQMLKKFYFKQKYPLKLRFALKWPILDISGKGQSAIPSQGFDWMEA